MNKTITVIAATLSILGCKNNITEIIDKDRDKIISVKDKIIDIKPDILLDYPLLYIIDSFLVVQEMEPQMDKTIHFLHKNDFKYFTSTGIIGRGPSEIARPGRIGIDTKNKNLYVQDHGKKVMWKFPLDSIISNSEFKPTIKLDLNYDLFIERFDFLNDTVAIGKAVQIKDGHWSMSMAKLNLKNNVIEEYGYEHPGATDRKSNSLFALSLKHGFYVNCYNECDLITICNLEGNLKHNIYGPDGLKNELLKNSYFSDVKIIDRYIFAAYIGEAGILYEGEKPIGNSPSKFLIYDADGNYIETIDVGYKFTSFCIDEENNRIILYFQDRPEALGYFNMSFDSLKNNVL